MADAVLKPCFRVSCLYLHGVRPFVERQHQEVHGKTQEYYGYSRVMDKQIGYLEYGLEYEFERPYEEGAEHGTESHCCSSFLSFSSLFTR